MPFGSSHAKCWIVLWIGRFSPASHYIIRVWTALLSRIDALDTFPCTVPCSIHPRVERASLQEPRSFPRRQGPRPSPERLPAMVHSTIKPLSMKKRESLDREGEGGNATNQFTYRHGGQKMVVGGRGKSAYTPCFASFRIPAAGSRDWAN